MNVYDCLKAARMIAPNSATVMMQYRGQEGNKVKCKTICPCIPLGQCFVTMDSDFGAEEVTHFEVYPHKGTTYVVVILAWKDDLEEDYELEVELNENP